MLACKNTILKSGWTNIIGNFVEALQIDFIQAFNIIKFALFDITVKNSNF
jgi:hypothetical protein